MTIRVLVISLLLMGGCAARPQLDVYLTNLEPQPSTALEQRMLVTLRLQNPTDRTLEATGLNVRLDVNGGRLATGVSDRGFTVPPLAETETQLLLSIGLLDVIRQVVRTSQAQEARYTISGKLHTSGVIDYPFRRSGVLSPESITGLESLAPATP